MTPRSGPSRPTPLEEHRTARYARWDGSERGFSLHTAATPRHPAPGHALVAVDLATVCGSDLHTVRGDRPAPCPGILGHEQVGTVVDVSAAEPPRCNDGTVLEVGDRVVWSVTISCGTCDRCRRGLTPKCRHLRKYGHEAVPPGPSGAGSWLLSGGFATHVELLPGTTIVRVPPGIPDVVAAPASCATATVAAVLRAAGAPGLRARELAGERVLVTGAGMLGVTAAAMAHDAGAEVLVTDPDPGRRDLARRFGAHDARDPREPLPDGSVDLAIELSGSPDAVAGCLACLDVGGRAVLAGAVSTTRAVPVDPERLVRRLLTVTGVHNYLPGDLDRAVSFLAGHHRTYPFADLVSGPHALDALHEAFGETGSLRPALRPTAVP